MSDTRFRKTTTAGMLADLLIELSTTHLPHTEMEVEEARSSFRKFLARGETGLSEYLRSIAKEGHANDLINDVNEQCPIMELDSLIEDYRNR